MLVLRIFSVLESTKMIKNWDIHGSKVTSSRHEITYSVAWNYCPGQEKCCVTSSQMIFHWSRPCTLRTTPLRLRKECRYNSRHSYIGCEWSVSCFDCFKPREQSWSSMDKIQSRLWVLLQTAFSLPHYAFYTYLRRLEFSCDVCWGRSNNSKYVTIANHLNECDIHANVWHVYRKGCVATTYIRTSKPEVTHYRGDENVRTKTLTDDMRLMS
jgi:hypothetical protein